MCEVLYILEIYDRSDETMIKTNKNSLLKIAVQGEIVAALPQRAYITTWDGKSRTAIGVGGINYNLKIGDKVFGWANGDRATPGVATDGTGTDPQKEGYRVYSSIGNEATLLSGEGKGAKGIVTGKFGQLVLMHFDDDVLEKLAIGDTLLIRALGVGLTIDGFDDIHIHGLAPDLLEKFDAKEVGGKLEVPVVKEIPHDLIGSGAGGSSLTGNWHIQTCYPPDIKEFELEELRFGDLVLLQNIQTDYGKGYYKGGATVGVVCSGPTDISGLGIGVTPILSTRFNKISARIDKEANIGKYLGIKRKETEGTKDPLKTNKDKLIMTAVQGVVQPPSSRGYSTTFDGKPKLSLGTASINYTVSVGDLTYGWANADHVEPDVTIQGRDRPSPSECALAILACIGNEAKVVSGDAKGDKGVFIGRHAGSDDLVWFSKETLEKLALNDKIQIKSCGSGLKIEGFEDVRLNKISLKLLENMGITLEKNQLIVPVTIEVPGYLMGSGIGGSFLETGDYDIQTTCPEVVEELNLKKIRLGDIVAIKDHLDVYGRGRYKGAVTIGVVVHGFSDSSGHGPGVDPIMSAFPGKIKTKIDPNANIAYYLGIKDKSKKE
jgi:hypothetical protein